MKQTFWSKNQVLITGIFTAALTAFVPYLLQPSDTWNWENIIPAAVIAGAGFFGNEARGKGWTMGGQIAAGLIAVSSSYEGHLDVPRLILIGIIAAFGIAIPPVKPASYEQSPTIQQAKSEAAEIKAVNDVTPPKQL